MGDFLEGMVRGSHTCENEGTSKWSGETREHYASEISDWKTAQQKRPVIGPHQRKIKDFFNTKK